MVCVVIAEGLPSWFLWSLQMDYLHGLCGHSAKKFRQRERENPIESVIVRKTCHDQGFTFTFCVVLAEGLPSWFVSTSPPAGSSPMRTTSDVTLEGELKSGKYGVVRSLLRVLEGGTASKALLDSVIDACK